MTSLAALTMGEARRLVAAGQLDPAAVLAAGKGNDSWHSFTWRPAGTAPAAPASPKDGHPLALFGGALKANICRRGWPADCGSRILAGYRSPFTATAVARLESAGAFFLGVTAMDEFGMGSSCEYSAAGPALNPWDPARTPGGSSGGAAAAVAAGLAWFALGSDTGGSVRFPAQCCGLVGFKPAWGRVSRHGLVPFASSLDTIGVLARDVADAALVMQHMAGPDPRDATTLAGSPPVLAGAAGQPVRGMSVGVPWGLLDRDHETGLREDFQDCLRDLAGLGVGTREIDLPAAAHAVAVYQVLASAEAASNLARYDGSLYGAREEAGSYQQTLTATRTRGFGPEVQRRINTEARIPPGTLTFGLRMAHGLPTFLWACPACFAMEALEVRGWTGNGVGCRQCGARWRLDTSCVLHGQGDAPSFSVAEARDRVQDHFGSPPRARWEQFQMEGVALSSPDVSVGRLRRGLAPEPIGRGRLVLTREGLTLHPSHPEGAPPWSLRFHDIRACSVELGNKLQLRTADDLFQVDAHGESRLKWAHFVSGWLGGEMG